jgi:two-component system, OmpR family, alkaline phosphatase synthesis response regulator PhoP
MEKDRVLIVDDEEDILELVRYNLMSEGYDAVCTDSGEKAIALAGSERFDLLILDLMLPGMDGIEVAKRLKADPKTRHIPIIMLTAKSEDADIIAGLDLADDYVTKPFSPKILCARAKAVIRRSGDELNDDSLCLGQIRIYPGRRRVEVCHETVDLSFTEFQILITLSRRPGWVFSRYQIVDAVRGDNYPVTERSVDVQIVGLRKKMGVCGHYIETVRGVGYRFKEILNTP